AAAGFAGEPAFPEALAAEPLGAGFADAAEGDHRAEMTAAVEDRRPVGGRHFRPRLGRGFRDRMRVRSGRADRMSMGSAAARPRSRWSAAAGMSAARARVSGA